MKRLKYILIFILINLKNLGFSQSILNGDFEINSAISCNYNLSNMSYTNMMSYSTGFGSRNELDIQTTNCYANPPSKSWFVSLSKSIGYDELSLQIDTNLIAGQVYQIMYYEYADNHFNNLNVPTEIGLSVNPTDFGQQIFSSLPPVSSWALRSFYFIAPNNGNYLTVRIDSGGTFRGWNFVDDFQLFILNGIQKDDFYYKFSVYPNPFSNELNISSSCNDIIEVFIYDVTSRTIFRQKFHNKISINTAYFNKGIYIYKLIYVNGSVKSGRIFKE